MTAADLRALLRAHPEAALEAVSDMRIAGPWVGRQRRYHRGRASLLVPCGSDWLVCLTDGAEEDYLRDGDGEPIRYPTFAEAQAAADAHLLADGWVLVPTEGGDDPTPPP